MGENFLKKNWFFKKNSYTILHQTGEWKYFRNKTDEFQFLI